MSADDDLELAELLRRALRAQADRVLPAGDGLARIRDRVAVRRRRLAWLRPVVVMATAAGVAAAAVAAPALVRQFAQQRPAGGTEAAGTGGSPGATPSVVPLTSQAAPAARRTLPPQAGVSDMRTVWPYVSRAEGYYSARDDVSSGRHPELANPTKAAITFVQRYVGPRVTLSAGLPTARDRGVGVVVNRTLPNGSSHPVTWVYLVRVSTASDAPYVVASAARPALGTDPTELTVTVPPGPVDEGSDRITVSGTIHRPGAQAAQPVKVEVGDASGAELSFNQTVPRPGADPDTYQWTASVTLDPGEAGRAVTVAAWTLDDDAGVLEFVAAPVPLRSDPPATTAPGTPGWTPPTGTPTAAPTATR